MGESGKEEVERGGECEEAGKGKGVKERREENGSVYMGEIDRD